MTRKLLICLLKHGFFFEQGTYITSKTEIVEGSLHIEKCVYPGFLIKLL